MARWDEANLDRSREALMEEMREELEEQLASSGEHQDGALLSLVIDTLNNPHCRNVLAGESLAQLRRGLLLPEEMASATERINRAEMACSRCGHSFAEREVASYQRNTRSWLCTKCALPTHVACSAHGCNSGWVKIPAKLNAWLQKDHVCEEHTAQAAQPATQEQEVAMPRPTPTQPGQFDVAYYDSVRLDPRRNRTTPLQWTPPDVNAPFRVTASGLEVVSPAPPAPGQRYSRSIDVLYAQMREEQERMSRLRAAALFDDEDRDEP